MRYTIDKARIAHQTVDGEVIAIDFVSGAYFSMRGTACDIWQMLSANATLDDIISFYQEADGDASHVLGEQVRTFVSELVAANLLQPDATAEANPSLSVRHIPASRLFSTPELEQFEDMADLIQLDPVHDVTEAGWPHPKQLKI